MSTTKPDRVGMPAAWLWLLRIGGALVGFALGFGIKPLVRWVIATFDSAPAKLRLLAEIPTPWAVPILAILGCAVGYWLSHHAKRDSLTVTVDEDSIVVTQGRTERHLERARIGSVFTDQKEFVVLATDGRQLFRGNATDLRKGALSAALRRRGYPCYGRRDPWEADFRRWIDGHPDLDPDTNELLRTRGHALHAKDHSQAEAIHTQLQDAGILVRDRGKNQQYRRLAQDGTDAAR